jgi:hypothetical protein
MPMELLFALAQRGLPQTVHNPSDIDKLRVIAAAELVQARLPEVGAAEQKAEVLSITAQGRAALTKAYPQHRFDFGSAHRLKNSALADWLPSQDTYQMRREASRTLLDS